MDYHRSEAPGSIVIDTDARYLYYVMADKKAIRYGVTVGEEAQAWSGVARVGNKQEWPAWIPTQGEHERLGQLPARVEGGPHNPMGARGIYLFAGNKDTLFRIHGTNQPEYIGQAISSGCIRMTNEDVIDLYNRVKMGAIVVVLAPQQGDSPYNPRVAMGGDGATTNDFRGGREEKALFMASRAPGATCCRGNNEGEAGKPPPRGASFPCERPRRDRDGCAPRDSRPSPAPARW